MGIFSDITHAVKAGLDSRKFNKYINTIEELADFSKLDWLQDGTPDLGSPDYDPAISLKEERKYSRLCQEIINRYEESSKDPRRREVVRQGDREIVDLMKRELWESDERFTKWHADFCMLYAKQTDGLLPRKPSMPYQKAETESERAEDDAGEDDDSGPKMCERGGRGY